MFEHHSVYLSLLTFSFWVAVLILKQMARNKLYMHLKLFQRSLFLRSYLLPRSSSGREWNFLLKKRLVLSGMWFNSSLSSAFCKDHTRVLLKGGGEEILPNTSNLPLALLMLLHCCNCLHVALAVGRVIAVWLSTGAGAAGTSDCGKHSCCQPQICSYSKHLSW